MILLCNSYNCPKLYRQLLQFNCLVFFKIYYILHVKVKILHNLYRSSLVYIFRQTTIFMEHSMNFMQY